MIDLPNVKEISALQILRKSEEIKHTELMNKIHVPSYSYFKIFGHNIWYLCCTSMFFGSL
jgi:hypothetical protein